MATTISININDNACKAIRLYVQKQGKFIVYCNNIPLNICHIQSISSLQCLRSHKAVRSIARQIYGNNIKHRIINKDACKATEAVRSIARQRINNVRKLQDNRGRCWEGQTASGNVASMRGPLNGMK